MPKLYSFFAHFNRCNMQRGLNNVWTVHFRGVCYQVEGIDFRVPTKTRYNKSGRQPRATIRGRARFITIHNNFAVVR